MRGPRVPTIISHKANNWVDRGESALPTLERILAHLFGRPAVSHGPWLREHATAVFGMVAADATEVHVAGYLRSIARDLGYAAPAGVPADIRTTAIALWHAAKAALVRDFAERVLRGDIPPNEPTPESLAPWLAARLLTPEELAAHEAESRDRIARDDGTAR
jgi:hypothetical protein